MVIGVLKEIKGNEYRVAAVPATVHDDHLIPAYEGEGPDIAAATETNRGAYEL